MGLTRKYLKSMNLTEEQVDSIIDAHLETVDALKADIEQYKGDAEQLKAAKKELDELKAKGEDGYKEKFEAVKKEFDDFKAGIQAKETKAQLESAVRKYYESKNITGKSLDIAMRGSAEEIAKAELENGKLKDTAAFDDLVAGTFSGLVSQTAVTGAKTETPHTNTGGKPSMSKQDIINMTDPAARMKAIAENPALFGLSESNGEE